MKYLLIILLTLTTISGYAQEVPSSHRVAIGYYGHFGIQPGLKISSSFSLKASNPESQWLISPQIGFFTNPGDDRNFVFGGELGLRKPKASKTRYQTWGLGLNYLAQSKFRSFSVNLGNGQNSDRKYIHNGFLLPTISYEHGWATDRHISGYMKYAIGQRILGVEESSFMLFIEFGVKLRWKKSSKTTGQ